MEASMIILVLNLAWGILLESGPFIGFNVIDMQIVQLPSDIVYTSEYV